MNYLEAIYNICISHEKTKYKEIILKYITRRLFFYRRLARFRASRWLINIQFPPTSR